MKSETWQTISGFGQAGYEVENTLKIDLEIFTTDSRGLKVSPTPGATMTITDKHGDSRSYRVIHSECEHVADFLRNGATIETVRKEIAETNIQATR